MARAKYNGDLNLIRGKLDTPNSTAYSLWNGENIDIDEYEVLSRCDTWIEKPNVKKNLFVKCKVM